MNNIWQKIKSVARHELVSGSFYIFLGTIVSSFLAFVLNIYFARELSYADYGTFSSLLSIVTMLTIPTAALSAVIVRYVTAFFAKGENDRAGAFYIKSFKYLILFSLVVTTVLAILYPLISSFLKIDQIGLIILTGISVAFFYLATLNIAFLQSLLKFKLIGLLFFLAGVGKLITGIALVFMGLRVYGALLATFVFSLIDFVLSLFPLKKVVSGAGSKINIDTKELVSYAAPTTLAIFALSSFISSDVLLVKHFFNPTQAGFYGGLSLIGRVIFYFTGPIALAMFPLIVKKHTNNENYRNLFHVAIILVLIPSVLITGFYFLFPKFTIELFLGGKGYLTMVPYLGLFGVFITIYSLNNIFLNFFVSIKKTLMCWTALFWAAMQIVFICIFHENFYQIIYASIITSVLLLVCLVLYYLKISGINYSKK